MTQIHHFCFYFSVSLFKIWLIWFWSCHVSGNKIRNSKFWCHIHHLILNLNVFSDQQKQMENCTEVIYCRKIFMNHYLHCLYICGERLTCLMPFVVTLSAKTCYLKKIYCDSLGALWNSLMLKNKLLLLPHISIILRYFVTFHFQDSVGILILCKIFPLAVFSFAQMFWLHICLFKCKSCYSDNTHCIHARLNDFHRRARQRLPRGIVSVPIWSVMRRRCRVTSVGSCCLLLTSLTTWGSTTSRSTTPATSATAVRWSKTIPTKLFQWKCGKTQCSHNLHLYTH